MTEAEMLAKILTELDEIKRYVASTYANTDNEVAEIRSTVQKVERKMNQTDAQIDKIERFERGINEIRGSLKSMERKIK